MSGIQFVTALERVTDPFEANQPSFSFISPKWSFLIQIIYSLSGTQRFDLYAQNVNKF